MTSKQVNKFNMFKTVKTFFAQEQIHYTNNNPLIARVAEFNAHLTKLEAHADTQATDTTANTSLKTDARSQMIQLTVAFAHTAADYFEDKDTPLAKQLSIAKSKLQNWSGAESKLYCKKLYDIVNTHIEVLNPDYVSLAEAQEWITAINQFDAKTYDTNISKDSTQNATNFLSIEFKNVAKTLKRTDRLMTKYQLTNKEFLNRYKLARKVIDLGTRTSNILPTA